MQSTFLVPEPTHQSHHGEGFFSLQTMRRSQTA